MSSSSSPQNSCQNPSLAPSRKVVLKFPDASERQFDVGVTGYEVARTISVSLSKKSVVYSFEGELRDLDEAINNDGSIEIITRSDERALELIRHDCAHALAEAVQELWPDARATIGPVIENGFYYDFDRDTPFTSEDLPVIEKKMRQIIARNEKFSREIWSRQQARKFFETRGETYKVELVEAIPQDQDIKIYRQGDWLDLCRGPHMRSTGDVGNAFKLTGVAGAYWRGNSSNAMLTRIYGTAFAEESQLKNYMYMLEEAQKRDHRKIGREMDLFHFQEEGPGVIFWHANGWRLFQNLTNYMRRRLEEHGYEEVSTPQILDRAMWEKSGHWEWYHENMFITQTEDDRVFAIKPMNCPGHVAIFKHGLKSYRDLPTKLAEFGVIHRYEPSGALHGLMRVRGFTQDDAHVFCTEEQLHDECMRINDLIISTYDDFGFSGFEVLLSTRPEKRVGDDASWDHAEEVMHTVLKDIEKNSDGKIKIGINPGEGAFYGPKFEYVLKDAVGRSWQCGTTQVDFNLPDRLGAFYIDSLGNKKRPVMIHRAICGSMERFLGILIENYAGRFPLWLAPRQVVVATITEEANNYAEKVTKKLKEAGLVAEADLRNEKISYKVREHSLARTPVIMVCGMKEAQEGSVNIRRLGSREQNSFMLDEAIVALTEEAKAPDKERRQIKLRENE